MISKYRPEVDGLRCIAVILVILHHLNLPGFSGGFVGVDVFFVISGYLITGIILSELKQGNFTFGNFYKRRIIRLAPAYFAVLIVTSILAWFTMLPEELENFAISTIYSTFFAANFHMWGTVGGYFGATTDTIPLLHLWSLAVEEQFYVVWPVTLLILYRVLGGGRLLWVTILIALILGLAISQYGVLNHQSAAYYLMPTRAFELLMGAVLAFVPLAVLDRVPKSVRVTVALAGLGLILHGNSFLSGESQFPGLNALYPCSGAALMIAFLRQGDPLLGQILSRNLAVGIGKVSYPAYLWHWPIIAFLNMRSIEFSPLVCIAVIVGTFLLAALTFWFIEKPIRNFRGRRLSQVVGFGFVFPSILFTTISVSVVQAAGVPERFDVAILEKSEAIHSWAHEIRGKCHTTGHGSIPPPEDECVVGKNKESADFLIVGDSHANHFVGMLDVLANDAGLRGYDVTQDSTPFLPGVYRYYVDRGTVVLDSKFKSRNNHIEKKLTFASWDYVVLGGNYRKYLENGLFSLDSVAPAESSSEVFKDALKRSVELIIDSGAIPILISGNPTFEYDVSSCTLSNLRFDLGRDCHLARKIFDQKNQDWNELVGRLEQNFDKLIIIDPTKVMCDEYLCYSELNSMPLFKDGAHLNYEGSKQIGKLYLQQIGNPFESGALESSVH